MGWEFSHGTTKVYARLKAARLIKERGVLYAKVLEDQIALQSQLQVKRI
jgi:hypothetical protein